MVRYTCWNCSAGKMKTTPKISGFRIYCEKLMKYVPKKHQNGPCSSHSKRKKNCQK